MKKLLSFIAGASILVSSGSSIVACNKGDSLGLLISNFNNDYFKNMMAAGKDYAKEKGYTLNTYDSKADISGATDQTNVKDSMTKGDKAIIINPANVKNNNAIKPALEKDIPIINIDTEYDSSVGERGAAGFVSEQTKASSLMFKKIYNKIYGEDPSDSNKGKKVKVYAMWSNQDNDAEQKRFKGFVLENQEWIQIINKPGSDYKQGSVATGNENTGDAAGNVLTNEWSGSDSAKNAHVIWAGNDPMALGMKKAIDLNTDMKKWFSSTVDDKPAGFIVGFDGSDDVAKEVDSWSETERNHIYLTVKQEYSKIVQAAIDKAIELIKAEGAAAKTFDKSTEVEASVLYPKNEAPKA
ncbi:sugar ABC transporter substrate-binding protein [Spiroplasma tabanidicola]|uniref:Ribose transport system substrate-binding protein n=1 Tax=Spiroplasma tabanidicola TaxID=324079 RepID=A0A6I6CBF1_9MOLU|nr:substrate-binding domain-containing protein [Spiroplasma tabanidicola]QGS52271.1 ribose transport system substrate-binding protein [Spiroplasma tabanidicola]